ncbi:MAG TPA: MoaD/ThiS family protein [Mycobacteriales bacterium]|nr:MoaD/ThiS family protein [Mycobacteriales bacterium]
MTTVRVMLPGHLKRLAQVEHEVEVDVEGAASLAAVLDALEASYPVLRGTIRDQVSGKRRNFIRYFACSEDLSHEPADAPLPERVQNGDEPLLVVGAMAGG